MESFRATVKINGDRLTIGERSWKLPYESNSYDDESIVITDSIRNTIEVKSMGGESVLPETSLDQLEKE